MLIKTQYSLSLYEANKNNLLMSCNTAECVVKECKSLGWNSICIADYHSLSGVVDFFKNCKENKIKPIVGCQFFTDSGFLTLVAKNKVGYYNLVKALSRSHDPDRYTDRPILKIEDVNPDGLLLITGGYNSQLARCLCRYNEVYTEDNPDRVTSLLNPNVYNEVEQLINSYSRFEILIETPQGQDAFSKKLRDLNLDIVQQNNFTYFPSLNPHYCKGRLDDQLAVLSMGFKTNLRSLNDTIKSLDLHYLIPVLKDYIHGKEPNWYNDCEEYDIFSKPKLPKYEWTNGKSEFEYLTGVCREGYKRKNKGWDPKVYGERAKYELNSIKEAEEKYNINLAGYFLIVRDYIKWAKDNHILVGPSRGSSGGSLVAYLCDITEVDPIKYNLLFPRFYNVARASKGDLPDIDTDFPPDSREKIIDYIRSRYGDKRVAQICTFGRMMGASIVKELIRVHEICSFQEANKITQAFPQESFISGELEKLEKEENVYSIVRWVLENEPESLIDYCKLQDGQLTGPYAFIFEQAIRLEGLLKTQGKHAAGIIIAPEELDNICPMIHDKSSDKKITGLDMEASKMISLIKCDILSLSALSKLQAISEDV